MKPHSKINKIDRRRFLGHSGIALLGTTLAGVSCNKSSEGGNITKKGVQSVRKRVFNQKNKASMKMDGKICLRKLLSIAN